MVRLTVAGVVALGRGGGTDKHVISSAARNRPALHLGTDLTNGRRFKETAFAERLAAIGHHDLMLGIPIKKLDEAWRAACKRAKVPTKLFHDFRRTSARNLIRAGVPEHWAMRLTGHKTTEVFRRYAITSESDLRDAVSRLAAATPDQTVRLLRTATV